MTRKRKNQPTESKRPAQDELVDVLLILARYLDSKGLQEMTLKMNDGRRIGIKLEEDFWSLHRSKDETL
ncbi:hypothetical protein NIES30_09810 [Phormidium tenue NIES-30]|uniref:Uncharacterized protein n=1 Tax=Phormidium tenue NIES-30 TaxID=549789 RepID=A0A1U7J5X7_9CYAN|nr:hypothetical protein NIES30_09810 [Phormidium tenue NIES-30]